MFFHFFSFCYTRAFRGKLFNINYLRCNVASILQFLHSFVIIACFCIPVYIGSNKMIDSVTMQKRDPYRHM